MEQIDGKPTSGHYQRWRADADRRMRIIKDRDPIQIQEPT
jgi:hypothetical protein